MKRIIKYIIIVVIVVTLGVIIEHNANIEKDSVKPKKTTKTVEKKVDDRAEELQEALETEYEYNLAIDIDENIEDQGFDNLRYATYTEDGFYVYDNMTNLISFVDKKSCKMVPLCSKPACRHNDVECDAFYYTFSAIFSYKDMIYVVANDPTTSTLCLYRINKDGSERTLVKTLFAVEDDTGYSYEFAIHKGYLYMKLDILPENDYTEGNVILYRFELNGKGKKEILNHTGYWANISIVNFEDDYLYLCLFEHDMTGYDVKEVYKYYCYNVKDESLTEFSIPEGYDFLSCYNGKIIADYCEFDNTKDIIPNYQMYQFDIDGSNKKSTLTTLKC